MLCFPWLTLDTMLRILLSVLFICEHNKCFFFFFFFYLTHLQGSVNFPKNVWKICSDYETELKNHALYFRMGCSKTVDTAAKVRQTYQVKASLWTKCTYRFLTSCFLLSKNISFDEPIITVIYFMDFIITYVSYFGGKIISLKDKLSVSLRGQNLFRLFLWELIMLSVWSSENLIVCCQLFIFL